MTDVQKKYPKILPADYSEFFDDTPVQSDYRWLKKRGYRDINFKLDVQETDNAYIVEAELPGVSKEAVNISIHQERLSITVEVKEEKEQLHKNYIHRERHDVSMNRSLYLPEIKSDGVEASLENGVLTIKVPKIESAHKPITVDVK